MDTVRSEYEARSRTTDPHRHTMSRDRTDITLIARLLEAGPPQGKEATVADLVYWMMRYYSSHLGYMWHFKRSPIRNIAIGRQDAVGEVAWLKVLGINRSETDEDTRILIIDDKERHRWRPLHLALH